VFNGNDLTTRYKVEKPIQLRRIFLCLFTETALSEFNQYKALYKMIAFWRIVVANT